MSGLELAERFYRDVVRPIAAGTPHGAALLGDGSEVLGFDDEVSTDHSFGPRVQLFLPTGADPEPLLRRLDAELPAAFGGLPVRFPAQDGEPPAHQVWVTTVRAYFAGALGGVDPLRGPTVADWLSMPWQRLATLTGGAVFADPAGELVAARDALSWYPPDVWRYVLAAQWLRIDQEEPFVGRSGGSGDELGSAVVAARLVRDQMRLAMLLERRYPPYSKWLGHAFTRLRLAAELHPAMARALVATRWPEREDAICRASEVLAAASNALGLYPDPPQPVRRPFHSRRIQVIGAGRFTEALLGSILDLEVRKLIAGETRAGGFQGLIGSVDQFVDSTDVLSHPGRSRRARPVPF
jgi:Domain of unknown function (DUF4037)